MEAGEHILEFLGVFVRKLFGFDAELRSGLLHLEPVRVHAGHKEHGMAVQPLEARERIGRNRFIGVTDMRLGIRIGNRGRNRKMRFGFGLGHMIFRVSAGSP